MIRWLAEYSRQKNLTFLPLWNLTDVTVKKFTRGKNLTFLPPWGDKRGALGGSIISTSYHCQSSRRNEASTSSSMLSMRLQKKSRPVCSSR